MLKDEVKSKKSKQVDRTGCCRFCGQNQMVKGLEVYTEEEMNELVTEQCECYEATMYARQKGQKERAHARIKDLFENEDDELSQDKIEFMHSCVDPIVGDWLEKVTIDVTENLKMTINKTAKGMIKVTRKKSISSSQEA